MNVSSNSGIVKIEQVAPLSYPFTYSLESGSSITVEAVPTLGYVFDSWSGDLSGTTNPAILMIDCNKSITANFSIDWTLVSEAIGSLVLIVLLTSILIIRRRAD